MTGLDTVENRWKREILDDFARWLDEVPGGPPEGGSAAPRKRALSDLFSLVMVLARDVARQNRSSRNAVAQLESTNAALAGVASSVSDQTRAIGELMDGQDRGLDGHAVALGFLEVRDALVRTLAVASTPSRAGVPPDQGLGAVASSLGLILRKVDAILGRHGITRVETVGQPFDPKTMNAIGVSEIPGIPTGIVTQEVRGGFLANSRLLQAADVIVSARPQRPETADAAIPAQAAEDDDGTVPATGSERPAP